MGADEVVGGEVEPSGGSEGLLEPLGVLTDGVECIPVLGSLAGGCDPGPGALPVGAEGALALGVRGVLAGDCELELGALTDGKKGSSVPFGTVTGDKVATKLGSGLVVGVLVRVGRKVGQGVSGTLGAGLVVETRACVGLLICVGRRVGHCVSEELTCAGETAGLPLDGTPDAG